MPWQHDLEGRTMAEHTHQVPGAHGGGVHIRAERDQIYGFSDHRSPTPTVLPWTPIMPWHHDEESSTMAEHMHQGAQGPNLQFFRESEATGTKFTLFSIIDFPSPHCAMDLSYAQEA